MTPILWIFEDQLSFELETLREYPAAPVLMIESAKAFSAWPFHKKRLTFLASAMRHFAEELREAGRVVQYYPLRKKGYVDSLSAVREVTKKFRSNRFAVVNPSEHHTRAWLDTLPAMLDIEIEYLPNTLFLVDRNDFRDWAKSLKQPVMEFFYRRMRKQHNILMDGDKPAGGTWNLDKENRKSAPSNLVVPMLPSFKPDATTQEVMDEINRRFAHHPGSTDGFDLPVTRNDAKQFFTNFLDQRLPQFGEFEDAMLTGEPVLFHSFVSPLINAGLLRPMECARAAEERYRAKRAPLNSVEGFVRQIIGWREYIYGIYHTFMPEYRTRNSRGSTRELPAWFWDAKTDLNCLRQSIGNVVENAYSHHIQRLMVICNFSTLAGLSPQAVNDWFYAMYIDSHDWVVTPNVIGMGMNSDGVALGKPGVVGTKPYISSAAYIDRMSDYCAGCRYNPKVRSGEDACPFNYLYWTFLHHYRDLFSKNPRMAMMLKNLDRIPAAEMKQMISARERFIDQLPVYPPSSMRA